VVKNTVADIEATFRRNQKALVAITRRHRFFAHKSIIWISQDVFVGRN